MLADPQSLTISGTAVSLPRTSVAGNLADYTSADGTVQLRVQQSVSKTVRRTSASVRRVKVAADAITGINSRITSTIGVSVTSPLDGFTVDELAADLAALAAALTASSSAMAKKILAGEK